MNYLDINKTTWDKRTKLHVKSKFYDVDGFIQGQSSLNDIEINQLGNVKGKSLLHLQCHFGQDSLSLARLGADVTGVDLSSAAINEAIALNEQLGLNATFVCDDVCHFGDANTQQFDIVYTSYGVLCWLPDLTHWARGIVNALKCGGEFHLVEFHTFNDLLSGYAYFPKSEPDIEEEATYTENCDGQVSQVITWPHSLSSVISALINSGLIIELFEEHAYNPYDCFDGLKLVAEKRYQMQHKGQQVPLIYAIKARKP
ncbi:class I SAM-dependent methyltransferase [Pseudoalteromonas sp. MMG012]|uniref:class I SAM-dependent methyltransferase n=1 Tax=Pseudoalteromonas sp. MMG012 TaxID=2822686 RepID=UPI001B39E79B|nr:class I SAM-dependent methyltransferase [Pseudoalteromonas sp. MMG012]MBQ4851392.1 class I SAM-dependent methyltransferase [Pseudoalteromonas sp. MMG012]